MCERDRGGTLKAAKEASQERNAKRDKEMKKRCKKDKRVYMHEEHLAQEAVDVIKSLHNIT
jgi:hypothetical protein